MCARVCVCVCVRVCGRALKLTSKIHFELRARPNDQIHTKHVKTDGLETGEYSLKTQFISSSEREQLGENCVSIFCLSDRLELVNQC